MGTMVIVILVAGLGYLLSLRLHPFGRLCRKCKGTGIERGMIFRYSVRQCTRCGGNQMRGRYGVRTLHRGGLVWGERKPAQARERRARHYGR